ncbi:acyltransferase family protein [Pengzhenrongella sicca]|uniref:Acyltransferase n=1 Tax=Pengzhenrongella sicca TaxID=2819238 RepID=A0A8A4ZFP2_9MICO|nr:acyltransferase [Pengzhenrongella sicca]QTE30221.1 acyltransferase [Pengzhenrongella sicca]
MPLVTMSPSAPSAAPHATAPAAAGRQFSRARPGARLAALDGLRFLAAAAVVTYHFTVRNSQAWGQSPAQVFPNFGEWAVYGALGPELFFVISGFVILMTAWGKSVSDVVASRVARLFPAYWAAVLLTGVLLLWLWPGGKEVTPGQVAVNLTMLQSLFDVGNVDGVYWTLWAELRFYALILLLVGVGITRRRVMACAALWPAAALLAHAGGPQWLRTLLICEYAPLFAAGMVLFVIRREGSSWAAWLLVAANTVAAVWLVVPDQLARQARNADIVPSGSIIGAVVVGSIALVGVVTLTRVSRVAWPWLTTLGALTFPLYLVHEHWGWWAITHLPAGLPPFVTLAMATAFTLALAAGIHYGIERTVGPRLRCAVKSGLTREPAAPRA